MKIRTRFAPSPTGYLHVGGIRTALFAWLLARQCNGQFILRLEDTDKKREVAGADKHILDCLSWLGLDPDEGPFYQSHDITKYSFKAKELIDKDRAYPDPRTPEELDALRADARAKKKPFLIRDYPLENPSKTWNGDVPLRFKSEPKNYSWHDEIMGDLKSGSEAIDDFILMKSDLYPTYNFAHIVDDYDTNITHVIRGQEFLPSVPNYLNLYEALGIGHPVFATVPPILNEQGNKKLSKRDGAKDVLEYRAEGYLPEAMINFLASLGWNDGTEQEIFSRDELIKKFSLDQVQKSGARFDEQRLLWMNGHYIRETPVDQLMDLAAKYWPDEANKFDADYKKRVLALVRERLKFLAELPELSLFFFKEPSGESVADLIKNPVDKQLKKIGPGASKQMLRAVLDELSKSDFTETDVSNRLNALLEKLGTKPGILFALLRIAVTGAKASPQIFGTCAVLGKETVLARLNRAITTL